MEKSRRNENKGEKKSGKRVETTRGIKKEGDRRIGKE